MTRVHIVHETEYRYSRSVFLEPHILRLRPRQTPRQELTKWMLELEPEGAGRSDQLGLENNVLTRVWFQEPTEHLNVVSRCTVELSQSNPFDFLPEVQSIPGRPSDRDHLPSLAVLRRSAAPDIDALADQALTTHGREYIPFLIGLNQDLHERLEVIHRESGPAWAPEETLREEKGACRDVAVLFMDVCRTLGIPARFVSGYAVDESIDGSRQLHAWPEVMIPGGGWRGFDPSLGLAVSNRHVAVCASVHPARTLPVEGTFRGTDATSDFTSHIKIDIELE